MTRTEMMNGIVRTYGHEDPLTIRFFQLAELYKDRLDLLAIHYAILRAGAGLPLKDEG